MQREERKRPPALWLLFLYIFFLLPLGLPYVNWDSQEVLFVLPGGLTPVLGSSFVHFKYIQFCQLYLNKTGEKTKIKAFKKRNWLFY